MRTETTAVVLALLVVGSLGVGYFAGYSNRQSITTTATVLQFTTSGNTSSSANSTVCTIPDSGEVIMQVLNSTNGRPIASAPVLVEFLEPLCPPNPHTVTTLSPMMTNGTGYVAIDGEVGDYTLSVSGHAYSASATVGPGQIACVTLGVPSGETHITYTAFEALSVSCNFGF